MDDQILIIDDEDLPQSAPRPAGWKVMIVDDEPEVHRITKITLNKFEFDGKPIDFLHAYSAAEAKALLALTPDVALLLLDVVMEVDHAGLEVVSSCATSCKTRWCASCCEPVSPARPRKMTW